MFDLNDYGALLSRAKAKLPKEIQSHSRFVVPDADIFQEGKTSVFKNFGDIISVVNREPSHLLGYLLKEMGTAGTMDGKRVIFKSKVFPKQVDDRIKAYVETYVMCSECYRPDTKLVKDGRVLILKCDACGAHRPITAQKAKKKEESTADVVEGREYEVKIQNISARGDGVAKIGKFTIFVPGTKKDEILKIKIVKTTGTIGFAVRVLQQQSA